MNVRAGSLVAPAGTSGIARHVVSSDTRDEQSACEHAHLMHYSTQ